MPASTTVIASNDPARLLRRLTNHWRHKFEIRSDNEGHAFIPFDGSGVTAEFQVEDGILRVTATQPDADALPRLQHVIEEHLQRFARDGTLAFDWQPA